MKKLSPSLPHGQLGFFLLFLLIGFCFMRAPVFFDADTAWHLATGDLIRATGTLPEHDSWSYTAGDTRWYNIAWAFDVIISYLNQLGGMNLLYAVTLIGYSTSLILMAHIALKRGAGILPLYVTLFLSAWVLYAGFFLRPNIASCLFAALFYIQLASLKEKPQSLLPIFLCPLITILWVNMHGGFLILPFLIGCFGLESLIARRFTETGKLAIIALLCLGASLINPYGTDLYHATLLTLGTDFKPYIREWDPVKLGDNWRMTAYVITFFITIRLWDPRIRLADKLLSLGMLFMALATIRHSILMAVLSIPYLAQAITYFIYDSRIGTWVKTKDQHIDADLQKPDTQKIAWAFALISILFIASPTPRENFNGPTGFKVPTEEAVEIKQRYGHKRLLNYYDMGGLLIHEWRGTPQIFIDGRASTAYSAELLNDYWDFMRFAGVDPRAEEVIKKYNVEAILLPTHFRYSDDWKDNPKWKRMYEGKVWSVFEKR